MKEGNDKDKERLIKFVEAATDAMTVTHNYIENEATKAKIHTLDYLKQNEDLNELYRVNGRALRSVVDMHILPVMRNKNESS